jgi:hypothetical protein
MVDPLVPIDVASSAHPYHDSKGCSGSAVPAESVGCSDSRSCAEIAQRVPVLGQPHHLQVEEALSRGFHQVVGHPHLHATD